MRISVCIPTYNGEKYIQKQLESILSQLGEEDEIIISDDSSTDRTVEIIKSTADSRIQIIENCTFKSPTFNLENALTRAKGDFIFLSDQDDIWYPDKIKKALEKLTSFDMVVCNGVIIDQDENMIHPSYFEWKGSRPGFLKNLAHSSYLGCSLAFNRKILNRALPFPKQIIIHDLWLGLIAESTGRVIFIEEPLFSYRRHASNFTAAITKSDTELSDFSFFFKIKYRIVILFCILKRVVFGR